MAKRPSIDPSDDNFGAVLNCAVRYALGRRSYMPYLVTSFITPLLPHLSNKTIWCFKRDLEECRDFGDPEIDELTWREFWRRVIAEDIRRLSRDSE